MADWLEKFNKVSAEHTAKYYANCKVSSFFWTHESWHNLISFSERNENCTQKHIHPEVGTTFGSFPHAVTADFDAVFRMYNWI